MKSPAGRWFRIEQIGTTFVTRPKGRPEGRTREEESHSSLDAAIDRVNRDRPS
jgi:hypothetical protein